MCCFSWLDRWLNSIGHGLSFSTDRVGTHGLSYMVETEELQTQRPDTFMSGSDHCRALHVSSRKIGSSQVWKIAGATSETPQLGTVQGGAITYGGKGRNPLLVKNLAWSLLVAMVVRGAGEQQNRVSEPFQEHSGRSVTQNML